MFLKQNFYHHYLWSNKHKYTYLTHEVYVVLDCDLPSYKVVVKYLTI